MLPGTKLSPATLLPAVRRRFWLIAIPPLVTFFAALLYSSTVPDLYQSDMLIAIDPQRVPDAFVRSTVTLETDRRLDALTVQVLSRTRLQQLIEQFDLYPEDRKTKPAEDVILLMRSNILVDLEVPRPRWGESPHATAFHVRYTHPDPMIAKEVAQQLGQSFVEQNTRDRGSLAGATNKFLEGQLTDARRKLEAQEAKLEAFRQRHGKELPTQSASNMQALTTAQMQAQSMVESIARDRDRKQMLERLYRDALNEPPAASPATTAAAASAAGGPSVPAGSAQQQLASARASLTALRLRYKPDHPDVVRAGRLVTELEPKAAAEADEQARAAAAAAASPEGTPSTAAPMDPTRREGLRQMRAEIESLDRQIAFKENEERRVRGEISEYQRRLEAVPGLESEWVALTRDYDTQQAAYKDLLSKSEAAQVAANLEKQDIGERFRIVDAAAVPVHPLPAIRIRVNAAGLGIGLFLGLAFAAFLEFKDSSFRSDTDVMDALSMPVLVMVPRIITADEVQQRNRRQFAFSVAGAVLMVVAGYVTWAMKLWQSLI